MKTTYSKLLKTTIFLIVFMSVDAFSQKKVDENRDSALPMDCPPDRSRAFRTVSLRSPQGVRYVNQTTAFCLFSATRGEIWNLEIRTLRSFIS